MKATLLIISFLYLCTSNATEEKQTLIYDLKVSGKSIGKVNTTKVIDHNQTTYTSNTDATVKMLISIDIKTRMRAVFEDGKLIESDYKLFRNNTLKETASINYKDGKYILSHNGKRNEIKSLITKSTIMLPYYMPKNNEKIFEEIEGNFKIMKLINEDNYNFIQPHSNQKDDYRYKNGIMQYCLVRNTLVNFEMTLVEK